MYDNNGRFKFPSKSDFLTRAAYGINALIIACHGAAKKRAGGMIYTPVNQLP